jgi:hypothetical protein
MCRYAYEVIAKESGVCCDKKGAGGTIQKTNCPE